MFTKRILSLVIFALVLNSLSFQANASSNPSTSNKDEKLAAKVKAGINKLGTGPDARISVKLKDGKKLKGYISEAGPDSFVVVSDATGIRTEIPYPQAQKIKGNNLSTGAKVAIFLIVFAVIFGAIGLATK